MLTTTFSSVSPLSDVPNTALHFPQTHRVLCPPRFRKRPLLLCRLSHRTIAPHHSSTLAAANRQRCHSGRPDSPPRRTHSTQKAETCTRAPYSDDHPVPPRFDCQVTPSDSDTIYPQHARLVGPPPISEREGVERAFG